LVMGQETEVTNFSPLESIDGDRRIEVEAE
jgi:hypothetical protein